MPLVLPTHLWKFSNDNTLVYIPYRTSPFRLVCSILSVLWYQAIFYSISANFGHFGRTSAGTWGTEVNKHINLVKKVKNLNYWVGLFCKTLASHMWYLLERWFNICFTMQSSNVDKNTESSLIFSNLNAKLILWGLIMKILT